MSFKRLVIFAIAPLAVLALALGSVKYLCAALCPIHCSCRSRFAADVTGLPSSFAWLYGSSFSYKVLCASFCPHKPQCRAGAEMHNNKNNVKGDSADLGNLLSSMPEERKIAWFSLGESNIEPIFLEHGWHILDGSLEHLFDAAEGGGAAESGADGGDDFSRSRSAPALPGQSPSVLFFVRVKFARRADRQVPHLLDAAPAVNFIRASIAMTDKYNLAVNLKRYYGLVAAAAAAPGEGALRELQPPTFLLNDPDDCARFFSERAHYEGGRVWLMKASALSRGQGIAIYDKLAAVSGWWYNSATRRCRPDVAAVPPKPGRTGSAAAAAAAAAAAGEANNKQKKKKKQGNNAAGVVMNQREEPVEVAPGYAHFFDEDGNPPADLALGVGASSHKQQALEDDAVAGEQFLFRQPQFVVAQEYIKNPLLLGGKKMEIRSYWLLASVDPLVALYHDGTVRRTTRDYATDSWDDPLIHITNTFQQKAADPNYYATQDERKWTIGRMEDFVVDAYAQRPRRQDAAVVVDAAPGWFNRTLKPRLKSMIATVLKASIHQLRRRPLSGNQGGAATPLAAAHARAQAAAPAAESPPFAFALMGMDTILDDALRPWLTEIQIGPGMSMDDAVKKRLIGGMATEYLNIALEVQWRKRHGLPLSRLESARNFEVVFNEEAQEDASSSSSSSAGQQQ